MRSLPRGVTLIDVLVGSALVLVIFLGLFAIVRASLAVSSLAKVKNTATAIATTRMEYVRSLSYASVGTVGGIPAGTVPQYATTTVDGVSFVTRTYVEYADDPADGLDAADENGIITDYKHVKVTTSYIGNSTEREVTLVSNFSPPGIETTTGGGTLRVTVVNSLGVPVSGASVRIVNAATSPAVDVTTFSNDAGVVYLPGASPSTEYQVTVTKDGYSTAQTYARTGTNVNPTPGYLTVVASQTTASTFAIDLLGTLTMRTFSPIAPALWSDPFADSSKIVSTANATVSGGALTLTGSPGSYPSSGSAVASTTAPAYLASWTSASSSVSTPAGTSLLIRVLDTNSVPLPDADLPGNTAGFTGAIDLSGLSTTTYPALRLSVEFASANPGFAPAVLDWAVGYDAGPTPLPNVSFTLTGAKTIGSDSGGAPIYKTTVATTTDASGVRILSEEWDLYGLSVSGHTLVSSDPDAPYELSPGASVTADLILSP